MTVEFNPTVKSINIASEDLTKITLEVKNGSLDGKYDDIRKLSGKTVAVIIVPESYSYTMPFDKSVNKPTQKYEVYADGTVNLVEQEQTQLDIDGKGNIDIIQKTYQVDKEIIDEYILNARSLTFPGEINPREVLEQLDEGLSMKEIAEELEYSEGALIAELEHARQKLAPFADAWKKAKESGDVLPVEKNEKAEQEESVDTTDVEDDSVSENENEEKQEIENESDEVGETDGEEDPY